MLLFRSLVLATLFIAPQAFAQEPTRSEEPRARPADAIRYKLVVDGPNPPANALRAGLELARWQTDEEMTLDLLERLVKDASPQAREIAAIEGFYDAKVDVTIERDQTPYIVRVRVDPGPRTRVTAVDVDVVGPSPSDGGNAQRKARDAWSLPLGEAFRQADWIEAKDNAVNALRRGPYAAARIAESEARVEPDTQSAALRVSIDSGPAFRMGTVQVKGVQRYAPELVHNFSTLRRGAPYSQDALDDYVRRLAGSGYFASVQATIDPASVNPEDATISVAVIEAPTHRVEGAISFSTDTGYGARATYTNVNIDDRALQMRLEGRIESKLQLAQVTFTRPPTPSHWIDSLRISAQRRDIENTVETTGGVAVARRGIDERRHPVFGAAAYYDRQEPEGASATTSHATYLEIGYVRRIVDDLLSPTRGWMADVRAGVGVPGLSSEAFLRTVALSQAWYPLSRDLQLVMRGELGSIFGASRENVPSILRFRTGGDTSVRGYAYQSLGVPLGKGIVGGRYYALASGEIIRWINETWGIAAFVDAGDAADSLGDLRLALGYGAGARIRTPVGPFRIDLAYGERTKEVRLHFSVGVSF
ncbi:MAG TPA: autotransporter assembly complex family protein [Casimicrobiaceae bacterium]|nr:autotransporter assembly complex family protein [Casimicrobiaceae bacterium]